MPTITPAALSDIALATSTSHALAYSKGAGQVPAYDPNLSWVPASGIDSEFTPNGKIIRPDGCETVWRPTGGEMLPVVMRLTGTVFNGVTDNVWGLEVNGGTESVGTAPVNAFTMESDYSPSLGNTQDETNWDWYSANRTYHTRYQTININRQTNLSDSGLFADRLTFGYSDGVGQYLQFVSSGYGTPGASLFVPLVSSSSIVATGFALSNAWQSLGSAAPDGSLYAGLNMVWSTAHSRYEYQTDGVLGAIRYGNNSGAVEFYTGGSNVAGTAATRRLRIGPGGGVTLYNPSDLAAILLQDGSSNTLAELSNAGVLTVGGAPNGDANVFLDVVGTTPTARVRGSSTASMDFVAGTTQAEFQLTSSVFLFGSNSNVPSRVYVNGSPRAYYETDGSNGVGANPQGYAGWLAVAPSSGFNAMLARGCVGQSAMLMPFQQTDSTNFPRDCGYVDAGYQGGANVYATYKGFIRLVAGGTSGGQYEGVRVATDNSTALVGFFGVTPIARQLLATGAGHTVDDVITVLQSFGLCKQS